MIGFVRNISLLSIALGLAVFSLSGCGGTGGTPGVLGTPVISSITPTPVAPGNSITIIGSGMNGTYTTAYFTGVISATSTASSGNTTSVVVTVPSTLPAGTYSVDVATTDANADQSLQSNSVSISVS